MVVNYLIFFKLTITIYTRIVLASYNFAYLAKSRFF
jgi:hypothetical protein